MGGGARGIFIGMAYRSQVPAPDGYLCHRCLGPEDAWALGQVSGLVVLHYSNARYGTCGQAARLSYVVGLAARG